MPSAMLCAERLRADVGVDVAVRKGGGVVGVAERDRLDIACDVEALVE